MSTTPVLVVEDHPEIRNLLVEALKDDGHQNVLSAENGFAAAAAMETQSGRMVILLDLMMPGRSGWELLEDLSLREDMDRFSVIVVSATADSHRALRYVTVRRVLRKPFDLDDLLGAVTAVVGR